MTTVVPAFATATIPIGLQTTRFVTGTELSLLGTRQESALSQGEISDLIRESIRRETTRQETARQESAPQTGPSCAELKTRVDRIEQRLDQIEKKVDAIATKLNKLP